MGDERRESEAEAYRRFHAEDKARQRYLRELRRIGLQVESLALDIAGTMARQDIEDRERKIASLVEVLKDDKGFLKVMNKFTGRTPKGWLVACGCDGRMKALLRQHGWDVLREVIHRVRYMHMWYKRVRDRPSRPLGRIEIAQKGGQACGIS